MNSIKPNTLEELKDFVEEKKNTKPQNSEKSVLGLGETIKANREDKIHTFACDLGMLNTKDVYMDEFETIDKDGNVKVKKVFKTDVFPSTLKIDEKANNPFVINGVTVDFESTEKVVGAGRSLEKDTEEHRMLLAKVMYNQYLITNKKKFNIIVGCTLGDFLERKGEKTLKALSKEKYYTIENENEIVTLEINKIVVLPETMTSKSMCKTQFDKLSGKNVFILDLGGLNFSIVKYDENGKAVKDEIYYSNEGMNGIYSKLTTKCNMIGVRANDTKIEGMLRSQNIEQRYIEPFQAKLNEIFKKFLTLMEQRGYYKGESHVVFTGGGCQSLAVFIAEYFGRKVEVIGQDELKVLDEGHSYEIIKNSIFANVKGMYKAGVKKLEKTEMLKIED